MHRVSAAVISMGLAAVLSACGSDDSHHSTAAEATATVTVTATEDGSTAASTPPTGSASPTLPPDVDGDVVHSDQVMSPTHNIRCALVVGVECTIEHESYDPIPRPADCGGDWTDHLFRIGPTRGVRGACVSDTQLTPTSTELAYGVTSISAGRACQSQASGMTCWDLTTKHGFQISRESFHLF